MLRKSAKRPVPWPFKLPNALRKRSRSASLSVAASLRTRTISGVESRTADDVASITCKTASPKSLLGFWNSPATQNRIGEPSPGKSSCSVDAP